MNLLVNVLALYCNYSCNLPVQKFAPFVKIGTKALKQLNTGILMNHVVYFEFLFFQFTIKFNGSANLNHGTQNTKLLKKQGPRKEEGRSYITVNIHV